MAKSKYDTHVKDKLILVEGWARDGLTLEQIAKNLGISKDTLYSYKNKYSDFSDALKKGREVVDYEVEGALYKAAMSGNVTAQIFWLKNRKAKEWKDRKEALEIEIATKELELKEKKLALEERKLITDEVEVEEKPFSMPANVIAPPFMNLNYAIDDREYTEYVLPGGRGSTKSTYVSEKIIDLIINNPDYNAVVLRQVANTLRDSVFAQIQWSLELLGVADRFKCSLSPLEITYMPTGQKIFFRGADEPTKLKGIKVIKGYIAILWYEELDQFKGPEAVRTIQQSVIRGGDTAFIFKTFNPPKTKNNWANKDLDIPKENRLIVRSNYTQIPKKWLGEAFIEEAEHLKSVNPMAYEHEYLGIPNGNGGSVFDNVTIREITDDEIRTFDRIYNGADWGWFPDPWAFNRVHYDAARKTLYVFDEARANKKSNHETYEILVNEKGITADDLITCDSSEPKSVQDYRSYGLLARGAIKGPDSVNYSMKWLQSLNEIVIDNNRCPHTAEEFLDYEYERDKDGEIISGYPDANNHNIDAIRYATESIWRRKGQ